MERRRSRKSPPRGRLVTVGACLASFGIGVGSAWWYTDIRPHSNPALSAVETQDEVGADHADGRDSLLAAGGDSADPTDANDWELPTEAGEPESTGSDLDLLPPLPPEDDPLSTMLLDESQILITGSGEFVIAPGSSKATSDSAGSKLRRYRVEVEEGLPFDAEQTAQIIDEILVDKRGWTAEDRHHFQRVSDDSFDFRILIATPDTVDELCAPLNTNGEVSCGRAGRATLNAMRWGTGVDSYGEDLENYRRYLVNHEVGHLLGYGHKNCPAPGELAPVMVQQTLTTQGCEPNPWPFPDH